MRKLLTLVAGYAAGLAVAMKYRKDSWASKLQNADPSKSKLDVFLDEIVDIHKSAFADLKNVVQVSWEEIDSFDTLKNKAQWLIDGFQSEFESRLEEFQGTAATKKKSALEWLDALYADKKQSLQDARTKADSLEDGAEAQVDEWFVAAQKMLDDAYANIRDRFQKK